MAYLDEDVLYDNIEEKYKSAKGNSREAYSDVLDTICEMPRADVVEVKHGEWEEIRNAYGEIEGWLCKCGREVKSKENYCPKCGARMDSKKQKEVKCKDCEYLMFSDFYGECSKAYKGIVNPNDSCGNGKR